MAQKALITDPETEFVGTENVMPEKLPAVVPPPIDAPTEGIRDLRAGFMMMKSQPMQAALAEFKDRRDTFRKWLREQLVLGVHYGYPPGTEPKYADQNRKDCTEKDAVFIKQWKKDREGNGGSWTFIPLTQWQAKPSLYKAGADFLCDVLAARDEYEADLNAWKQLGEPKGTFVMTCRLISRATEECLGEGRGCRKAGHKGGDENNAIKMAKKCAKVDAVLNAWGLADLFTQDIEDPPPPPPVENPTQNPDAPTVKPRGKRVLGTDVGGLLAAWKAVTHPEDATPERWAAYVLKHSERKFNVKLPDEWSELDYIRVKAALEGGL